MNRIVYEFVIEGDDGADLDPVEIDNLLTRTAHDISENMYPQSVSCYFERDA